MKKIFNIVKKGVLAILSLVLILCLVAIIAVQGAIVWLNTSAGGNWLSGQIQSTMKDSPYQIELQGFALSGLLGMQTSALNIGDMDGVFARLQNVSIRVNPFPLPMRKLSVTIAADRVSLLRTPVTNEEEEKEEAERLAEIIVPDIYFSQIGLGLYVDRLELSNDIVKDGMALDIEVTENIKFSGGGVENRGWIEITGLDETQPPVLPLSLTHELRFDENTQTLSLIDVQLESENNQLSASGTYALLDQKVDLDASGVWEDVAAVSPDLTEEITFATTLNGTVDNFTGKINAETAYKDIPATVSADLGRTGPEVNVADLTVSAKDLTINGGVTYNLDTALAQGELAGSFDSLELVRILTGQENINAGGTFNVRIYPENETQATAINADLKNISYDDIRVATLNAQANVPDIKNWKSGKSSITVTNAQVPQTTITQAKIDVKPVEDGVNFVLSGNGESGNPFSIDGDVNLLSPDPLNVEVKSLQLKAGDGQATITGTLKNDTPDFTLRTQNLNLASLPYVDLSGLPLEIDNLDGRLTGTMANPKILLDYGVTSALTDVPDVKISGDVGYDAGQVSASFSGEGTGIRVLNGDVSLPMSLSLQPFAFNLAEGANLDGKVDGDFDLASLTPLFLGEGYEARGDVAVNTQIGGAYNNPDLNGSLRLRDAAFVDEINDIQLQEITGDAAFRGQQLEITSLTAKDKSGTGDLKMSGRFDLSDLNNPDLQAGLLMSNMKLLQSDEYDVRLNADMELKTNGESYLLSGDITPEEIRITLPEKFEQSIPSLNIVEKEKVENSTSKSLMQRFQMDMLFKAENQIFVRGWGLDAELGGELDITGTLDNPLVKGQLQTIRGRYEELGRRFAIDRAILRFQGAVPPSPYLDVKTSAELEEVTAHIEITGRAIEPNLRFTSTPSLPEDEVLSRILFGQDTSNISAYQAVQLAQTLRRFSGKGGGPDFIGTLRDVTGLDDIRVEGVGTGNATVGAGKYITDNVYLELEQGTGENSGAASVEIEVTPNVTVESKAGQDGDNEVGVFWEWGY